MKSKSTVSVNLLCALVLLLSTSVVRADISGDWTTTQGQPFTVNATGVMSGLKLVVDVSYCGVQNITVHFNDIQVNSNGTFPGSTANISIPAQNVSGSAYLSPGQFAESGFTVALGFTYSVSVLSPGCSYQGSGSRVMSATRTPKPTDTFALTVSFSGNGTGTVEGGGIYSYNTFVTPIASPADGSVLSEWQPAKCGESFLLTENTTCTAIFTLNQYPIEIGVSPGSGGQVSCTPNPVDHGFSSSCIASPNEGFSFSSWGGDCTGITEPLCELENVSSFKSIEANFIYTGEEHELIDAAVLPYARAVAVNETATAFASVINNGLRDAINCKIQLPASIPASFTYQTTDGNNILIGLPDTPVDIPVGATQGYVFGITPTTALLSREIPLVFDCDNAYPAPSHIGLNTLILTATNSVPPDMLAIGATPSSDGVVRLTNTTETGFFATAAVNIGSGGTVTARADDGGKNLPVTLHLCETNSVGNWILCGNDLTRSVASGQTVYYTVFVTGTGQLISFDPANNRLFLRFSADGQTVGATNVAVTTD